MKTRVPGLQIHFDAASRFQGKAHHLLQPNWMHTPVGLPADTQDPVGVFSAYLPRHLHGISDLRRGVATEVADATGLLRYRPGDDLGRPPGSGGTIGLLEGPILTEEAVEIAGLEEHRQIVVPGLRTPFMGEDRISCPGPAGTHPVSHAVGGKGVIVIGNPGS